MVVPLLHHAWGTVQLLEFCRDLPRSILDASKPGTYGSIEATLAHLVGNDEFYACVVGGLPIPDQPAVFASLDEMMARAIELSERWENHLDPVPDPERVVNREWRGGAVTFRVGTVLAQAVYHGVEHRTQVCTVLRALGIDPPALDAWAYEDWLAERREHGAHRRYRLDE